MYNIKFLDDVLNNTYSESLWSRYGLVFIKGNRNITLQPVNFYTFSHFKRPIFRKTENFINNII